MSVNFELQRGFHLGPWIVIPNRGRIENGNEIHHLEPMVMDVLLVLAANHGNVVSKDQIIDEVWGGRATTDETISAKIAALRNRLGDDSRNPIYIETVQRRGYLLKASVDLKPLREDPVRRGSWRKFAVTGFVIGIAVVAGLLLADRFGNKPIRSIAVVPFSNLSIDKDRFQFIVDGFSEELVVSLGRIPEMRMTRAPGPAGNGSLPDLADELEVDALIIGSLRTDGERVKITVQMTSASGFQIWADTIEGEAHEIFAIQERVAASVYDKIFGDSARDVIEVRRPPDQLAYIDYTRGQFFLAKRDLASLQDAIRLFEKTIERDPKFGPAYLRKAIALLLLADYNPAQRREIYDAALSVARQGAQNDMEIRDPIQLIHAFVHHQRGNWEEAASAFAVAFRSRTTYSVIYHWYSRFLGDLGFVKESLDNALEARAIEPGSQILTSRVAIAYMWNGDMENAGLYFDEANRMAIGVPDHHLGYAVYQIRNGQLDAARESVRTAFQLAQRPAIWVDPTFDSLKEPANPELHDKAVDAIERSIADGSMPPYVSMMVWTLFGETDRAMQVAIREASERGAIYELELIFNEEFAEFRRHADFAGLLSSLGVTRHWANLGCAWANDAVVCN